MITAILLEQFLIWIKNQATQSKSHKRNWTALANNPCTAFSFENSRKPQDWGKYLTRGFCQKRGNKSNRDGEDTMTQSLYFCWFHRQLHIKALMWIFLWNSSAVLEPMPKPQALHLRERISDLHNGLQLFFDFRKTVP